LLGRDEQGFGASQSLRRLWVQQFRHDLVILVSVLPIIQPMPLLRQREAFSHPDWLFEIKHDGFRALAYIERGTCRLLSRNGNWFKAFRLCARALAQM
jgi:ATP-dependent DNA ligase